MRTIRLYRVGLFSTFRFGVVLGFILSFLPSVLFTFIVFWAASLLTGWLSNLRTSLPLPGNFSLPISTIDLLGLQGLLQTLEAITRMAAWQVAFLGMFLWLGSALVTGLLALVAVAIFNLISGTAGGIELVVEDAAIKELPAPQ